MTLLLDSHVVLWWLGGGEMLSPRARTSIKNTGRILISPISFWEIALLASRGRVALRDEPLRWARSVLAQDDVEEAPLTTSAAVGAAQLDAALFPGDPADRLLYATARDLGVSFATRDRRIRDYARKAGDVRVIW